ncbi:MAG: HNH endonuclease [Rhodothermales bacterium]
MSTKRRGSTTLLAFWPERGKGPNGRDRCRYCGCEMGPAQSHWCSDTCRSKAIHEFSLYHDPVYQRRAVFKRDHGVCAACGRNTLHLRRRLQAATLEEQGLLYHGLLRQGYDRYRLDRFMLWEADHIVPVIEGGGGTGLENLQTLCVPCHKQKTTAMQQRRSNERKGLQDLFDNQE